MLELEIVLDFACCVCQHPMGVTLKCEGKGLHQEMNTIAAVSVPCPTCGGHNQVYFTPGGKLVRVAAAPRSFGVPQPSLN